MTRPLHRLLPAAALALLAGAAGAADHCTYSQVGHLPLFYTGPSLEITTEGHVNGKPSRMLVDTGAFASFITRTGAERHGLFLRHLDGYVDGVGGESNLYSVYVKDIALGPYHGGRIDMAVIAKTGFTPSYDAIIGANFLAAFDLEISLMDKQLKFFRASGCGDAFLGYWKGGAIEVPLISSYHHGSMPHLKVKVNGKEVEAMIDTGAGASSISLAAAKRVGLQLDSPKVKRMHDTGGVGENRIAQWRAVFDSFEIGSERINNPEISVIKTGSDMDADVDMLLGADFLRAHRLLFAISQSKLYLAYVGGTPFSVRGTVEPWMVQEAQAGNADAEFALARSYLGAEAGAAEQAEGQQWLAKAVEHGSPYAAFESGIALMRQARYTEAAQRFRATLDKLPDRRAALMLYLARQQAGEADAAKQDLLAAFEPSDGDWPAPVADFYLGRIDETALLAAAAKNRNQARARTCFARTYIAHWRRARGDQAGTDAMQASSRQECGLPDAAAEE